MATFHRPPSQYNLEFVELETTLHRSFVQCSDMLRLDFLQLFWLKVGAGFKVVAFGRGRGPAMAKARFPDHGLWPDPLAICV